jgi:hypothetical protein
VRRILSIILCLSSCAPVSSDYCPIYPVAGEKVAVELEKIPYENYENFWEWIARINKLRQETELCGN